jgi:hypothetical protein
LEKEFSQTTIINNMQMLEDDEVEDQNNVKESQNTSNNEKTRPIHLKSRDLYCLILWISMLGKKCKMIG